MAALKQGMPGPGMPKAIGPSTEFPSVAALTLSWGSATLEVQDMEGRSMSFKKGKTLEEKQASLFQSGDSTEGREGKMDAGRFAQAMAHVKQANKHRRVREWDQAIQECAVAINLFPRNFLAYAERGMALNGKGTTPATPACSRRRSETSRPPSRWAATMRGRWGKRATTGAASSRTTWAATPRRLPTSNGRWSCFPATMGRYRGFSERPAPC